MEKKREPDCLYLANDIVRRTKPSGWPEALGSVPDRCKAEVETYLRGMAKRLRVIRELREKAEKERIRKEREKARAARRR